MKLRGVFLSLISFIFFSHLSFAQTSSAYYNSGIDRASRQDFNGAITDFSKAIDSNPNEPRLYNYRGVCKFNLKDYSNAMSDFSRAIQLNQKFADAYYMRGMCRIGLHDRKGACEDFRKALEFNHSSARDALEKYCE
jgi:tetratricopeptide (TPR) repeat protein